MKRRSVCLLLAAVLATAYLFVALTAYLKDADTNGGFMALMLVMPHLIVLIVGVLFGWIGYLSGKKGFALAAAILYSVSAVLAIFNALFLVPAIVLGFVGYSNQKNL